MKRKTKPRRYNAWAGNPGGTLEDTTLCIESVWVRWFPHQCNRKRGYGKGRLYCKQHDPAAVAKKQKAKETKWDREWNAGDKAERTQQKRDRVAKMLAARVLLGCRNSGVSMLQFMDEIVPLARKLAGLYKETKT